MRRAVSRGNDPAGREGNKIPIRAREPEGTADKIQVAFKQEFPGNSFEVDSIMEIGPVIGKALQRDALIAITVSIIAIIIYIAMRLNSSSTWQRPSPRCTTCWRCWVRSPS